MSPSILPRTEKREGKQKEEGRRKGVRFSTDLTSHNRTSGEGLEEGRVFKRGCDWGMSKTKMKNAQKENPQG